MADKIIEIGGKLWNKADPAGVIVGASQVAITVDDEWRKEKLQI